MFYGNVTQRAWVEEIGSSSLQPAGSLGKTFLNI